MFPFEIQTVKEELNKELAELSKGQDKGFCQIGPKKWLMPMSFVRHAESFYNFEPRPDDLWIITWPRSGTTVTQELLWLVNNNLDYKTASEISLFERYTFLEFTSLLSDKYKNNLAELNKDNENAIEIINKLNVPGYEKASKLSSPRYIKSHLPLELLHPKLLDTCKVVYVARNPKDVAVSYYHHNKLTRVHDYVGDFAKYWDLFEKGLLIYSPYWPHVAEAWEKRDHPNMHFIFYEDLINDMPSVIKNASIFLNKHVDDEQVRKLADYLQIDNFRNAKIMRGAGLKGSFNPSAQGFIRRGKVGGNPEFTEEIEDVANKWIAENLSKTNIKFPM